MKKILPFILIITALSILSSCEKANFLESKYKDHSGFPKPKITEQSNSIENGHLKQTKTFGSEVAVSWLNMELTMLKLPLPPGTGSQGTDRCCGH